MGTVHSRAYLAAADRFSRQRHPAKLIVCADEVEDRAKEAQRAIWLRTAHTALAGRDCATSQVQVVNIATPNYMHLEVVESRGRRGKAYLLRKTRGQGSAETAEIDASGARGRGSHFRWIQLPLVSDGPVRAATDPRRKAWQAHPLPGAFSCGLRFQSSQACSRGDFSTNSPGSGVLGDLMSHVVDMGLLLAGPIQRVVGNRETFSPSGLWPRPGVGTHFSVSDGGPLSDVTNEDYVGALAQFANGAQGNLEVCRVIQGHKCDLAFEVEGTEGALSWDFERMNELKVFCSGRKWRARRILPAS